MGTPLELMKERAEILSNKLQRLQENLFLRGSVEAELLTLVNTQKELLPNRLKNKKLKAAIVCKDVRKHN